MSFQVRLFLGCLVAMTSTSAASAQFRTQRSSVPMRMNQRMNPMMMNPMMMNPMMISANTAASSSYGGGSGGGYGMNSGSSSGMGDMASSSKYSSANSYDQSTLGSANVDQTPAGTQLDSLLPALGISNKNGQFDWPLAFRLIPPGEDRDTMMQTEWVVQVAVRQAAGGKAAPAILQEASRDLHKMRRWLRDHEVGMAEGTYRAGSAYLRRIEGALKMIRNQFGG